MSIDQSIELRPIKQAESPDLGVRDEAQILQFNQRKNLPTRRRSIPAAPYL